MIRRVEKVAEAVVSTFLRSLLESYWIFLFSPPPFDHIKLALIHFLIGSKLSMYYFYCYVPQNKTKQNPPKPQNSEIISTSKNLSQNSDLKFKTRLDTAT